MRVTVGNLKGGVIKTTLAVYIALYYARRGDRVLLVDADATNSGCVRWSECDDWPENITVVPWALADLAKRVKSVEADYDHVVIDTGPTDKRILAQALLATDELVVPITPSPSEFNQLAPTFDLAEEIDAISPVVARVLLAKVRPRTKNPDDARAYLDASGYPRMDAEIGLRESYISAWRTVFQTAEMDAVVAELEGANEDLELTA